MKKIPVLLLFVLLSVKQYAQIEKGTYVPSISINGTYTNRPYSDTIYSGKTNNWNLGSTLGFGTFIKDNLLLMGNLSYTHSLAKTDYTYDAANSSYRNNGNSSFGNAESIGASLLHYKFLTENFAIRYGGMFSVNYSETINRNYNYTRGPFNIANQTYGADVLHNTNTYTNSFGVQFNLQAGIQYFVSKNLALTGNMGFFTITDSYSPYQHVKKIDTHTLTVSLTPSFNAFSAGLTYYFRPKTVVAK